MKSVLETILGKAFYDCGYEIKVKVITSNRKDLCDYQCDDAFKVAKLYHQNPLEIGKNVVDKVNSYDDFSEYFKSVTFVMPGFINMVVSDALINGVLNNMLQSDHYGIGYEEKKTYFLDYGGPNIAKPLHVGHVRTAVIGESIKRILQFMGHETVSDVHFGDYGLQIGEVIYGVLSDNKTIDDITLDYLEEVYPRMSKICKENQEILEKCAAITKDLQEGDTTYQAMWKKICEISLQDIKRIYRYLDVSFDLWEGESDSYPYIPEVTRQLNEKGLLLESDGALVVDVSKEGDSKEIPPLIYRKRNGAYLYGTTDLATIYERVTKYHPHHILYVVDARQSLHFEQVFRVCEKWGISTDLKHLGYGTVNGSDGKPFKTRSGDTIKLDGLFQNVKEAFMQSKETNQDMSEEDLDILVNAIIKFADLQNNREKDYIFDIKKFSNVVGKTGPYILYTYVRMNKIVNSHPVVEIPFNGIIYNKVDRDLRLKLLELEESIKQAFIEYMPHYIADYIYELCVLDNVFYQNNPVLKQEDEEQKQQWLLLLKFTNQIIKDMLFLLAIKVPSKM